MTHAHPSLPYRRRGAAWRARPCYINAELHGWPHHLLMLDVGMQLGMQQALAAGFFGIIARIVGKGKPGFLTDEHLDKPDIKAASKHIVKQ